MGLGARRKKKGFTRKSAGRAAEHPSDGGKSATSKKEVVKTLVRRGYAKEGDLLVTVQKAKFGSEGRNVLGETLPSKQVYVPRVVAGMNVMVEGGNRYITRIDGLVEVFKDEKGTLYIQSRRFRHGSFAVGLAEDEMTAFLSVTPPLGGGRRVSVGTVLDECQRTNIAFGLNRHAVDEAVKQAHESGEGVNGAVIARGVPPVNGRDGTVEFHVVRASGSTGRVRGDGSVDFKNLDRVTNVTQNQLVAVLTSPAPGQRDGRTVRGQVVKARSGKPATLEIGNNVRSEERNEAVHYFAAINGKLLVDGNKISVEPVLTIEGDVGPKTGHIRFSGMVHVNGNVQDTYNVFSKKDIIVEGNVGNCVIKTEGNLTVHNGILGKNRGLIQVGGTVQAKFTENSHILAGGDIRIQRAAMNCKLVAGSRIVAVEEKGQIIGGQLKAGDGIEVKTLGNESEHRMEVHVGSDFSVEEELETLSEKIHRYERALAKIVLVLEKLKKVNPDPEGLPENLRELYAETRKKSSIAKAAIAELRKKQHLLEGALNEVRDAEVLVHDTLHRGVKLFFGRFSLEPDTRENRVRIFYDRKKGKVDIERNI
jgi:hypothetical protein